MVYCTDTWTKRFYEIDPDHRATIEVIKSLNKFSDNQYYLSYMRREIEPQKTIWSLPMPEAQMGYIQDTWDSHRMYDTSQQEWVDVYP